MAVRWSFSTWLHFFCPSYMLSHMHLLYLDDSGSASNANEDYLVLAGVSVFESQANWVTTELDTLASAISPSDPNSIEFHASEIYAGRTEPWKSMRKSERIETISEVLRVLNRAYASARAFACAVHKDSFSGQDTMELAFEDLCSRFDLYLRRLRTSGDTQRGLIILDNSSYETSLQSLAKDFRALGTRWGTIGCIADVPMFLDSKASRIIQLADHIAYATYRRYETGDTRFFDIISARFHSDAGVVHGLAHKQNVDPNCMCPACLSRR